MVAEFEALHWIQYIVGAIHGTQMVAEFGVYHQIPCIIEAIDGTTFQS